MKYLEFVHLENFVTFFIGEFHILKFIVLTDYNLIELNSKIKTLRLDSNENLNYEFEYD